MTTPKVLWSGKYAGIGADVRVVGGRPEPYLAGKPAFWDHDQRNIFRAAVLGLVDERDIVRERLAKLETAGVELLAARHLYVVSPLDESVVTGNAYQASLNKFEALLEKSQYDEPSHVHKLDSCSHCDGGGK